MTAQPTEPVSEAKDSSRSTSSGTSSCCGGHQAAPKAASSCCGGHGHDHAHAHADHAGDGKVKDPVCGMRVDPAADKPSYTHEGQTYYFCHEGCRTKFIADPDRYLGPPQPQEEMPEGTIYTCPMHPEIRQVGPGSCPICGMALEPDLVSLDTPPNPELIDFTRRFWIGLALTLPVFVLEMGSHL